MHEASTPQRPVVPPSRHQHPCIYNALHCPPACRAPAVLGAVPVAWTSQSGLPTPRYALSACTSRSLRGVSAGHPPFAAARGGVRWCLETGAGAPWGPWPSIAPNSDWSSVMYFSNAKQLSWLVFLNPGSRPARDMHATLMRMGLLSPPSCGASQPARGAHRRGGSIRTRQIAFVHVWMRDARRLQRGARR